MAEHKKEVLNAYEAAEFLAVSVWRIRDAANKGELPARNVRRAWRSWRQALLDYLASGTPGRKPEVAARA